MAMPAVAALTDEEGSTAFRKGAKLLMENNFLEIRHAYGQAGLDNGRLSVAG